MRTLYKDNFVKLHFKPEDLVVDLSAEEAEVAAMIAVLVGGNAGGPNNKHLLPQAGGSNWKRNRTL